MNNEENRISRHILDNVVNLRIEDFKNESEKMKQRKKDLILLFESVIIKININYCKRKFHIQLSNHLPINLICFQLESNSNNLHK